MFTDVSKDYSKLKLLVLKAKVPQNVETLLSFCHSTQRNIRGDSSVQQHWCETIMFISLGTGGSEKGIFGNRWLNAF
jgi:hypothetical protein